MFEMWIKKTLKNDWRFCTFLYVNSYCYGTFLETYILAPFFVLFYEMWGFPNNWCEKIPGICVFLDVMISYMKQV